MNYKFCCIFFCTKKKRRRNTGIFDTNEYFLFFQKTHFTYSTYLRIFFFFHFTKIVTIIYILFLPSNFSPPNKNERGTRDDSPFLFFSSTVFMHNFFSLFFESRNTLQRFTTIPIPSKKRTTNFIGRCIRNPGKNFSHCLKRISLATCAPKRDSDVTSSHVFIRETFRSLSSKNRTSFFSTLIFSNQFVRPFRSIDSKERKARKVTRRMPISPTRGSTCDLSAAIFHRPSHFHRPRESWWLAPPPPPSPPPSHRDQPPFRDNFLKEAGINIYTYIFFSFSGETAEDY